MSYSLNNVQREKVIFSVVVNEEIERDLQDFREEVAKMKIGKVYFIPASKVPKPNAVASIKSMSKSHIEKKSDCVCKYTYNEECKDKSLVGKRACTCELNHKVEWVKKGRTYGIYVEPFAEDNESPWGSVPYSTLK